MSFFTGSPAEYEQVSNLTGSQLKNQRDLERSTRGGFTDVANYYRGNLSDNPADFQAFAAPEMRRFNEQIIPDLAEQFAGAGSLSSSGFRNAAVGAGTDLSERLAMLRANLRQNSAQGLQGLSQSSLNPHTQYQMTDQGSQGFLSSFGQGLGAAIPGFLAGGPGGGLAALGSSLFGNNFGQSSPYGKGQGGLNGVSQAVQNSAGRPYG